MEEDLNNESLAPPIIEYARAAPRQRPDRALRFGLVSLCLSSVMLLITVAFMWGLSQAANNVHQQVAALPRMLAANKAALARVQANQANRVATLQAAAAEYAQRPPPRPCDATQAQHIVEAVQSQLHAPMSERQRQTLINELEKPGQVLVDPALPLSPLAATGRRARVQPGFQLVEADTGGGAPGGAIRIQLYRSYKTLADYEGTTLGVSLDGRVYIQGTASPQTRVVAGSSLTRSLQSNANMGLPANYAAGLKSREFSLRVATALSACEAAVLALLFAAGFCALWGKSIWTGAHRAYAWSQLLLIVIGVAAAWVWSLSSSSPSGNPVVGLFFVIAMLAAYPVILLPLLPPTEFPHRKPVQQTDLPRTR